MTTVEQKQLLERVAAEKGQAAVAKALGYSSAAISRTLSGDYPNAEHIYIRCEEVYGSTIVDCPVFGCEISLGRCADERRKLPRYTNPVAGLLSATCPTCKSRR